MIAVGLWGLQQEGIGLGEAFRFRAMVGGDVGKEKYW